jgi:hypothetical protein
MFPCQAMHVALKEIDGETLVLDREHGKVHQLNATASFIWRQCDGHTSIAEITAATAREFGSDLATIENDVVQAIRQMESLHLIVLAEPGSIQP